jgi:hypothetical protein
MSWRDRGDDAKITIGHCLGSPIALASSNDLLGLTIAEGIEDALNAHQATGMGAWAAAGAGPMAVLADTVPTWMSTITVQVDGNADGRKGPRRWPTRLYERGDAELFARLNGRGAGEPLPRGERACLIAIAQHHNGVRREQLTVLTGYKRSSRHAYVQRLGERGCVSRDGERIVATPAGIATLGADYQPLPTGSALREHVLERLPEGERRILEFLIGHYPHAVDRPQIDAATNYQRSSRDAYLQRLGARELVEARGREVKASDHLFD